MTTTPSVTATSKLALQQLILDEDLEHLEDLLAEFNLFDVLKMGTNHLARPPEALDLAPAQTV
jgi:hypothetical protein